MKWVLIALAISRAAAAEGTGVLAIGGERAAVLAAARGAVRDAGAPRVVDALAEARAARAAGAVPIETLARFRRVREQIDEGWRAFLRVQIEFAASRLAAARTDAEALVPLPGGAVVYADASLRLGAVLGHEGRTKEAQAAIALALALDPDRPVTLAEFSPDIVAMVDAVRALAPPKQDVRVGVEPAGALVAIDAAEAAASPVATSLARGQHVVVARAPMFQPHAQAFAVDDAPVTITVALDRDDDAAALLGDNAALVDAAIRYAELDDVLVVAQTERRGGPTLLVQRCAGLPAKCSAVVEVGYTERSGLPAAIKSAWQSARAGELRYPPSVFGELGRGTGPVAHRCEWCRNPWVLGGIGLAAVAATVGVIAVVSSSRPPPVVSVDPGTF